MYSVCTVYVQCLDSAWTVHILYLYSAWMVHVQCIFRMLYGVNRLLCSEAGKTWLISNRHVKKLLLAIISQIQRIVVCFVLAASDDDNHPNDDDPDLTTFFVQGEDSDLAAADCLITYFEKDLLKAIEQQKLNNFDKITPIYRKVYPDDIPSPATGSTSPHKGAVSPQKVVRAAAAAVEAKAAAAATVAARSDNTRCPNGNDRYGLRNQPNAYGDQQNHYDINREQRPVPNEQFKKSGVFKYDADRLPWLKCQMNQTGQKHPPLVSVQDRPPGKICLTDSICGFVCRRLNCSFIHLVA